MRCQGIGKARPSSTIFVRRQPPARPVSMRGLRVGAAALLAAGLLDLACGVPSAPLFDPLHPDANPAPRHLETPAHAGKASNPDGPIAGWMMDGATGPPCSCTPCPPRPCECTMKGCTLFARLRDEAKGRGFTYERQPTSYSLQRPKADVDKTGMVEASIKQFSVKVFTYPAAQDQFVSGLIQKSGAWEPEKLNRLCDTFKKYHKVGTQAHFLDVGANIGSISVPMARCLDKIGDVISVEAMPHIADHVMAAVEANKLQNARLFNYALTSSFGAQDGELKMSLDTKNKGGTNVVGNKHNEAEIAQLGYKILTVPITTLDSILAQDASLQKVLVMKIDIEGSEGRALHGAHKLLTSYPPCFISIELIPEWTIRASTPKDEILSLLRYAGYDAPMKTSEVGDYFLQQVDLEACIARVMGT